MGTISVLELGSKYDNVPWDHEAGLELNSITFMTKSAGVALVEDTKDPKNNLTLYRTDDVGSPGFGDVTTETLTLRYGFNGAAVFDHLTGKWHFHEKTTITRSAVDRYVKQVNERFALAMGLNEFAIYDLATSSWMETSLTCKM